MHEERHDTPTAQTGWRAYVPVVLLCFLIGMSALFYVGNGFDAFYGPSQAENEAQKQKFRDSRTLLMLQLAKCRNYGVMKTDGRICGGSSLIYENLESSHECRMAEEVAKELGVAAPNLTIAAEKPPMPAAGS